MSEQKKLVPVIEAQNQILSRLCDGKEIEIPIWGNTNIKLGYHGWPTICKGDGDTLYASASLRIAHIDPYAVVVFMESHDKGYTWSEPKVVIQTPLDNRDSGCLYLGNGKLIVTTFTHDVKNYIGNEGAKWHGWQKLVSTEQLNAQVSKWDNLPAEAKLGGSYIVLSDDYGKTWSEPIRMPVKAPHGCSLAQDGKTALFFGPAVRPEMSGFTNLPGRDEWTPKGYFHLFASEDAGHTWAYKSSVKLPDEGPESFYDEGYCIQLKDGSYVAGIRSEKNHFGHWATFITRSEDGINWTQPTPIYGPDGKEQWGAPPHLLQLKSGALLLSYSWRHGDCGSRGRLSFDGGKTWGDEFIICISDQPQHGDLGYPSTVELDDGTLITATYQAYKDDKCPSVLYTRWRLEEAAE